jgi:hypothetical protein
MVASFDNVDRMARFGELAGRDATGKASANDKTRHPH